MLLAISCNGTSPAMWGTSGSDSLACSKLQGTRAASQDGKKWLVVEAWDFPVGGNLRFFGRVHYSPSIKKIQVLFFRVDIALRGRWMLELLMERNFHES